MTERIFFKRYDSAGKFPDGRVKLDVHFKDSEGNMYVWTPDWQKGIRTLFLEAYRIERLNRLKGLQVEKFEQTAREVSSEVEIESYDDFDGELNRLEKGKFVIGDYVKDQYGDITNALEERKIPLSIEFHAKIMQETKSFLNWIRRHKGYRGTWIIINEKLFDVEWFDRIPLPEE